MLSNEATCVLDVAREANLLTSFAAELIVEKEGRRRAERVLGTGTGEQQRLGVDGGEERGIDRHEPTQRPQDLLLHARHVQAAVAVPDEVPLRLDCQRFPGHHNSLLPPPPAEHPSFVGCPSDPAGCRIGA